MSDDQVTYNVFNWGPCVVKVKISDDFKNRLLTGAESARAKKLDYTDKLAGIIKEEYAYEKKEEYLPEVAQCLGIYDVAFQRWKSDPYERKPEYLLTALWVNYMKQHEFNPPHDHSDQLSFVIFLKVPEEIKKEQEEYKGKSGGPGSLSFLYGEGNRQAITYQSVHPKEGDMFIFPAWMKHYVAPFKSDCTRVSVSGNVSDSLKIKNLKKKGEKDEQSNSEKSNKKTV